MSARRDEMIAIAKTHAGYGLLDTPCSPRRSAYVDGAGGDDLFTMAQHRWWRYRNEMLSNTNEDMLELTEADFEVLGVCPVCQLPDGQHKIGCPRRPIRFPHIYDDPDERWLVELRVSYSDTDVHTAEQAAAAALALTTDKGCGGTHWVVTDRHTGQVTVLEQCIFAEIEVD